ncbi:prolipoprotein diacylglyceryl transferase [Brevibacterium spongiae]|uniref:Prolipoprotein diacylglyceryl transferase n=1 Tax=Brevibacterium spongiae TaxID=2909672 RepID=A0ABY5SIV4_9MICO|nr:prolipoprotein diacylglyceryl transferase [Brevibacterium spongiae]UVI34478.1 prolipoprotein diacylglyceryl transferase [Brevibacterium spongiae]
MSFSPAWLVFTVLGLGLALWMTGIQWRARGGHKGDLWAITVIGVPAAIVGGRIGHVLSAPDTYFGSGGSPLRLLALWDGGFSFWGALILGLVSVWVLTRYQGIRFLPLLDSVAPGLILGHVAGAFSDWFDGRLELATVLAESVWNLLACIVLIVVAKRLRLGYGQVFALYLVLFGLGRILLEALRIGTPAAETARLLLGLPLNVWTAVATLLVGFVWIVVSRLRHRTQETGVYTHGARTLLRRHRRGKHTFEVNAANIDAAGVPVHPQQIPATPQADADAGPRQSAGAEPAGAAGVESASAAGAADAAGAAEEESGIDLSGRHSFGFFGAVTSAISIVPDVRGASGADVRGASGPDVRGASGTESRAEAGPDRPQNTAGPSER